MNWIFQLSFKFILFNNATTVITKRLWKHVCWLSNKKNKTYEKYLIHYWYFPSNSNSKKKKRKVRYTLNFVDVKKTKNNLLINLKNRNHRDPEMKKLFERGKLYFQKREEEAARKREEKANGDISKKALKEIKVENNK